MKQPITSTKELIQLLRKQGIERIGGLRDGWNVEKVIDVVNSTSLALPGSVAAVADKELFFAMKRDTEYTHYSGKTLKLLGVRQRHIVLTGLEARMKDGGYTIV
jgi:hypothetical protein